MVLKTIKMESKTDLLPFEGKEIRKIWYDEQWYFSVVDVIEILAESQNPQSYWGQLKKREPHLLTICQKVKLKGRDGKNYPSDCANTEGGKISSFILHT